MAPGSQADPINPGYEPGSPLFAAEGSIRVDTAIRRILARARPLPAVELPLFDCLGLVLAGPVRAELDVPPFTNSAMDGYAVRSSDTGQATVAEPVSLAVVSLIPSGEVSSRTISPGEAARIMTGAPLPPGADAVVRQEEVVTDAAGWMWVSRPVSAGDNVRPAGEDIAAGSVVLSSGTVLDPSAIGVLASVGSGTATVHRRPVVGILSTGDEVVPAGKPLQPGQIRDANGPLLAALVQEAGGVPVILGIARDDLPDIRARLHQAGTDRFDVIISSGGVSVGDFDLVKDALAAEGQVECWRLLIKPGKPLAYGQVNGVPFLGLPGNPVAAYVGFVEFARPLIRTLLGRNDIFLPELTARLSLDCDGAGERRHFLRARLRWENGWVAEPIRRGGSGVLSSMLRADCFIVIPEDTERLREGDEVTVQLLRPDSDAVAELMRSSGSRPDGH